MTYLSLILTLKQTQYIQSHRVINGLDRMICLDS